MQSRRVIVACLILAIAVSGPGAIPAADPPSPEQASDITPTRVSYLYGEVSFWRPGAQEWAEAKTNTPLAPGDVLYTGPDGNAELQIGPRAFVRAGNGTQLGLDNDEPDFVQFRVTAGHAAFDVREIPAGHRVEIDTPNAAFTIDRRGYYHVDLSEDTTTFRAHRGGSATATPASGAAATVATNQQIVIAGAETPNVETSAAPPLTAWDRWNNQRTTYLMQPTNAQNVSPAMYGTEELAQHGTWRTEETYGSVWVPASVPPGWVPYSAGRWIWDPRFGWTWLDAAPWGWAPYHYGRWVYADSFWGWAPGPVVVAPVYAPALVSFFGAPGVGVSVGVGFPFVSWVALGFGEPVIPWWGPVGFVGTCWWGGWGGPRIVNNVVIQHNTFVNVRNVTVFQNTHVHNAVIGVNRDHFGRGHVEHVRLAAADVQRLRPIHGHLGVKPTPASLVAKEGHALRPPQAVHARPVVATRPPQDHSQHLRAAGLNPPASATPPPRLVHAPRPQGGGRQASPGGRAAPPPPPGTEHRRLGQAGARPAPPPERARSERPNPGGPHEHGAPHAPAAAGQPHGGTRALEHAAPPAAPRHGGRMRPASA